MWICSPLQGEAEHFLYTPRFVTLSSICLIIAIWRITAHFFLFELRAPHNTKIFIHNPDADYI